MSFSDPHDPAWEPLLSAAWAAREHAHAPYSGFRVGAALLTTEGSIMGGCNVENASFPLCACAEHGAILAAVAAGMIPGSPVALVVVTERERLTPPCGACRQILMEFSDHLPILLANRRERSLHHLSDLLPEAFTSRDLGATPAVSKLSKGRSSS